MDIKEGKLCRSAHLSLVSDDGNAFPHIETDISEASLYPRTSLTEEHAAMFVVMMTEFALTPRSLIRGKRSPVCASLTMMGKHSFALGSLSVPELLEPRALVCPCPWRFRELDSSDFRSGRGFLFLWCSVCCDDDRNKRIYSRHRHLTMITGQSLFSTVRFQTEWVTLDMLTIPLWS